MKTCFSEEKVIKQFGAPLPTNPPISEQLFHDLPSLLFVQILKIRTPLFLGGRRKLWSSF